MTEERDVSKLAQECDVETLIAERDGKEKKVAEERDVKKLAGERGVKNPWAPNWDPEIWDFVLEDTIDKVELRAREDWGRELVLWEQTVRDLKVVKVSEDFEIREKDGGEEVVLVGEMRRVRL